MYNALDIAKYIIFYSLQQNTPITNLKLQKLLYYLWIEYFKVTNRFLFNNNICAWPLGPVVPEVYHEYCSYGGATINQSENVNIDEEDRQLLNRILEEYIRYTASRLVDLSHKSGKPWDEIFSNGFGNGKTIPFEMIISLEC